VTDTGKKSAYTGIKNWYSAVNLFISHSAEKYSHTHFYTVVIGNTILLTWKFILFKSNDKNKL